MAQRDLSTQNTVTQVVAKQPNQIPQVAAEIGKQIITQSQEAKINENVSKAQLDLNALQNQYQIDFQSNPTGGLEEYKQQRQAIFDKYGEEVSPMFRRYWNQNVAKMSDSNDATQQAWTIKQSKKNTISSINESMKNNFQLANTDGQAFGKSADPELGVFLDFNTSHAALAEFGKKNLGEMETKEMMENYNRDYMKSFISGVASTNPMKAAKILEDPKVKGMFTSEEVDTFENVIKKQQKENKLGSLFQQMQNEDRAIDLVNGEGDYYSKRLQIDEMEMSGQISSTAATQARRVLTSRKAVDAITSTDKMSEIINQIHDLNAVADTNGEDYLNGVNNIRAEIMRQQEVGELNVEDARKLNNELRTLTSKKTADATQQVGMEFYDANQTFEQLPPEYRAQATRQLFYETTGQDLTDEQMKTKANAIVDIKKKQIRDKALRVTQAVTKNNEDFLKTTTNKATGKPYSMQDVEETASIYGITPDEVIARLKANQK